VVYWVLEEPSLISEVDNYELLEIETQTSAKRGNFTVTTYQALDVEINSQNCCEEKP
jgi:hypothetical protein